MGLFKSKNLSKISINPFLLFFSHIFLHMSTFPCLFPTCMLTHILIFSLPPSSSAIVLYQLQLTTSQVGLREILDHGGAASSLNAFSLLLDSSPRPRWGLVMGSAKRHLAKLQKHFQLQAAWCSPQREFRPKVEKWSSTISLGLSPYRVYFNCSTKHLPVESEAVFLFL